MLLPIVPDYQGLTELVKLKSLAAYLKLKYIPRQRKELFKFKNECFWIYFFDSVGVLSRIFFNTEFAKTSNGSGVTLVGTESCILP